MGNKALAERLAAQLLRIRAISFSPGDPFTWASGLRAPVYCDNRITISYPEVRREIRDGFARLIDEHDLRPDVIAGTATAGIPHAAWLADLLGLPLVYVRSRPKGHGQGSQVEGRLDPGSSVVVIEDLVSTGGSSRTAVEALEECGASVSAVLAIFSYQLDEADRTFNALGIPLITLTGFDTLFRAARTEGTLSEDAIASIRTWRANPIAWSDRHS